MTVAELRSKLNAFVNKKAEDCCAGVSNETYAKRCNATVVVKILGSEYDICADNVLFREK